MGEEITLVYNENSDNAHQISFRTLTDAPGEVEVSGLSFLYNIVDEVRIPETVDIDGKTYTVTQTASNFLIREGGMKKLIIPQTFTKILSSPAMPDLESVIIENAPIEEIRDFAFDNCKKLTTFDFGNACKLKELGICLFRGCESLKQITIPESIEILGDWAFSGCTSLKSIVIPQGVTSIVNAFTNCTSLESVEFKGEMI